MTQQRVTSDRQHQGLQQETRICCRCFVQAPANLRVASHWAIPDGFYNVQVQCGSLFKRLVQGDLAQLTPHGGLGKLDNSVGCILYTIGGLLGVYYLSPAKQHLSSHCRHPDTETGG